MIIKISHWQNGKVMIIVKDFALGQNAGYTLCHYDSQRDGGVFKLTVTASPKSYFIEKFMSKK